MEITFLNGDRKIFQDLRGANLRGANLRWANLSGANLSGADLSEANLRWADLSGANLSEANLSGANLRGANWRGLNWRGANLRGANLPIKSKQPDLRALVAQKIRRDPDLYDQSRWGDGKANAACKTPCCVAGWACHLGGGDRGLGVPTAAYLLLWEDNKPMPTFHLMATKEEILAALES